MVSIRDNRKTERKIEQLNIGDYFVYDGDLYVVITNAVELEDVRDNYYDSDVMNVLDLKSGLLFRIDEETVVDAVDVEITIS